MLTKTISRLICKCNTTLWCECKIQKSKFESHVQALKSTEGKIVQPRCPHWEPNYVNIHITHDFCPNADRLGLPYAVVIGNIS